MKFSKRIGGIITVTLVLPLATMLIIPQLHPQKRDGSSCLYCVTSHLSAASAYNYTKFKKDQLRGLENFFNHSWLNTTLQEALHRTPITTPVNCVEKNCQEFLSEYERAEMGKCESKVRTRGKYNGSISESDCRFLPEMGRHPVALVSAQGSGNTWTRGLLEKATGICTGFLGCDVVMRAQGFVGENIRSGKALVVKTHSTTPRWVGEEYVNMSTPYTSYSSAVLILRNPVMSAIAEWNRRASEKMKSAIAHERHTYTVPAYLFKGDKWESFLNWYLNDWRERLENWVINQDTHPVHILRYEDLQRDTPGEIAKVLDFLHVSYDLNILKRNLMEDYAQFHRSHKNASFEHYSIQQKQLLRLVIMNAADLARKKAKANLLRLNEYLLSIHDD